ncbi:hypothetical protein D3C76_1631980 [compost metagenome]
MAVNRTTPCTTGKSFAMMASAMIRPIPCLEKTVSMTTVPASISPTRTPIIVNAGIRALRRACRYIIDRSFRPLARSVII